MVKKPAAPKRQKRAPTPSFTLRMEPELRAEAEAAARADSRSLGQWIKVLVRRELERTPKRGR